MHRVVCRGLEAAAADAYDVQQDDNIAAYQSGDLSARLGIYQHVLGFISRSGDLSARLGIYRHVWLCACVVNTTLCGCCASVLTGSSCAAAVYVAAERQECSSLY